MTTVVDCGIKPQIKQTKPLIWSSGSLCCSKVVNAVTNLRYQGHYYRYQNCFHLATQDLSRIWAASWQNQQNDLCSLQRLRSAWASTQSDQSSLSAGRNIGSSATHWAHCEDSDRWAHRSFCWFCDGSIIFLINQLLQNLNGFTIFISRMYLLGQLYDFTRLNSVSSQWACDNSSLAWKPEVHPKFF